MAARDSKAMDLSAWAADGWAATTSKRERKQVVPLTTSTPQPHGGPSRKKAKASSSAANGFAAAAAGRGGAAASAGATSTAPQLPRKSVTWSDGEKNWRERRAGGGDGEASSSSSNATALRTGTFMKDPEKWIADGWMAAPFQKRVSKTILAQRKAEEEKAPPRRILDAAALALAKTRRDSALDVGARVEARFQASLNVKWKTFWFPGTVAKVNHADGTFDVRYDDGDYEAAVKRRFVRPMSKWAKDKWAAAAAAPARRGGGGGGGAASSAASYGEPEEEEDYYEDEEEDGENGELDEDAIDALDIEDLNALYGTVQY